MDEEKRLISDFSHSELQPFGTSNNRNYCSSGKVIILMRLNNSEDTASKLVVSILDMETFFGFILSDSMTFNSFFNYTLICKKLVSELRRFGTTEVVNGLMLQFFKSNV